MNKSQIQDILTIAKYQSFTKAANELHMSQPALSLSVQKYEEELGVELFDRSTFPIKLTYAGEKFVEKAPDVLFQYDKLEKEIRDIAALKKGRIRIGIVQGIAPYVIPSVIQAFYSKYPEIEIKTINHTESDVHDALLNNTLDFGISSSYSNLPSPAHPGLDSLSIGREELVLVSDPAFISDDMLIDGLDGVVDIRQLGSINWIMPIENSFSYNIYKAILKENGVEPNILTTVDDSITLFRLASTGFAPAIVPKILTQWVQPVSNVNVYSLSTNSVFLDLHISYKKNAHIGEPEKYLFSLLRKNISDAY